MRDFHIHAGLVRHTLGDIPSFAKRAKELGYTEITILEHISPHKIKFPHNKDKSETIFIENIPNEYTTETSTVAFLIDECKKAEKEFDIKINTSLEVEYYKECEEEIKKYLDAGIDYLTLGCHHIEDHDANDENKLINIGFKENKEYILEKYGKEKMFELYFKTQLQGVKSGLFKLVAHLDFFGRFIENYDSREVIKYADPVLKEIIKRDMLLEINIVKDKPNPTILLIKRYKELGGNKLCFGSDSHSIKQLENSIERRKKILEEIDVDIL